MIQYTVTASVVVRMAPVGFEGTSFTMFSGFSVLLAKGMADILSGLLVVILQANPPAYAGMPLMILIASFLNVVCPSQARKVLADPVVHSVVGGNTFIAPIPALNAPVSPSGETNIDGNSSTISGDPHLPGVVIGDSVAVPLESFGSMVVRSSIEDAGDPEVVSEVEDDSPTKVKTVSQNGQ